MGRPPNWIIPLFFIALFPFFFIITALRLVEWAVFYFEKVLSCLQPFFFFFLRKELGRFPVVKWTLQDSLTREKVTRPEPVWIHGVSRCLMVGAE